MNTRDFDFDLPPELIAQTPAARRDESRLLVLHRRTNTLVHGSFRQLLTYLSAGDVLVLNNSRVIPARLRGANVRTAGEFELLLLEETSLNDWWAMLRPARRARPGTRIRLKTLAGETSPVEAEVTETNPEGHRRLRFTGTENILAALDHLGEVPLPPYIKREGPGLAPLDRERYQTVFAQCAGSVAAPTAGLHFTGDLLDDVRARGIEVHYVTLHVGPGTFAPVKAENVAGHVMHEERFVLPADAATAVNDARRSGRRVIAVGTTSVRVLESVAAANEGQLVPGPGRTRIFIYPPYEFRVVNALLTNFHLPRSTLLMLVSAFASPGEVHGREMVLAAYREAVRERYRFFSYGDAMLLL